MIVVGLGAKCNKSVIILNYQLSFINYQYIMKKILPDLIAILAFIILSFAYFFPADIEGRILFQHDSVAGVGAGQESKEYLERTGERTRWTNSIFGGMPTYQMSPSYDSTKTLKWVEKVYQLYLPGYVVLTFIMMLGFYILLRAFGLSAWLAGLGGIIWGLGSTGSRSRQQFEPAYRRGISGNLLHWLIFRLRLPVSYWLIGRNIC